MNYESRKFLQQIFSCCWIKLFLKYNVQLAALHSAKHCHIYICYIYTCHIPVIFKRKMGIILKKDL